MTDNRSEDYFDNDDSGHVDTREQNFECENPDEHLGCDLGIDVQGRNERRQPMIGALIALLAIAYFINRCTHSANASCKM